MAEEMTESWLVKLQGSRPWTEAEGRRVFEAWSESGQTVAEFARQKGLKSRRVYGWRERLGASPEAGGGDEEGGELAPLVPVVVRAPPAQALGLSVPVAVSLRGGVRVEVATLDAKSAAWVTDLVRSLGEVLP
jgi:hypothetical protein